MHINSFISSIGGKKLLRKEIIKRFPDEFGSYIEVFGGAGWVLFDSPKHAKLEVYNDVNSELVNLFRCVKQHAGELQRCVLSLNSRELFEDYKAQLGVRGSTDIQRAARYFMLIKTSFGADKRSYCCNVRGITNAVQYLKMIQPRLSGVVLENKSFEGIIKTYDQKDALFYLDPPYHGTEKFYDSAFGDADHILLRDILSKIKGSCIVSYNDDAFVRDLYKNFHIEEITRQNNLSNTGKNQKYRELIIRNYQ